MSSAETRPRPGAGSRFRHWFDRISGIGAAIVLIVAGVRLATGHVNRDASAGQILSAALFLALMAFAVWSGVRAWMRSEPEERPALGHPVGPMERPLWWRLVGTSGLFLAGTVVLALVALKSDDVVLRVLGAGGAVSGTVLVVIFALVMRRFSPYRKRGSDKQR